METDDVSRYCTESCEPDFGEREAVDWVCELGVRTGRFDWAGLCNLGDILEDTPLTGLPVSDRELEWGVGGLAEEGAALAEAGLLGEVGA